MALHFVPLEEHLLLNLDLCFLFSSEAGDQLDAAILRVSTPLRQVLGSTDPCSHTLVFMWVMGSKLRALSLLGKHFAHSAISVAECVFKQNLSYENLQNTVFFTFLFCFVGHGLTM